MLHFSLVRAYFYWLVIYTDTSGTFSSAGAGWLCTAGLKPRERSLAGGSGKGPTPGTLQQCKNKFTVGSGIILTLMKSFAWGERVCISSPLPHGSVLRIDSFWMWMNTRKQNI